MLAYIVEAGKKACTLNWILNWYIEVFEIGNLTAKLSRRKIKLLTESTEL